MPVRRTSSVLLIAVMLTAAVLCVAPLPLPAHAQPARAERPTLIGTWRITRGMVAPWVKRTEPTPDTKALVGETMRVSATRIDGSRLVQCSQPHFEVTRFAADALFQGDLPAPASKIARDALGFTRLPVPGISLNCDAGLYEFHQADDETMLVALNNVIWTLTRSAGATAAADSPTGVVERFLERHYAGEMGFDKRAVLAKRAFYSDGLIAAITHYFATPSPNDEVPAIDGDPFTDSQEYPTRFSVRASTMSADGDALVPVVFRDGYSTKQAVYVLHREHEAWRIGDVRYGKGEPTLLTNLR